MEIEQHLDSEWNKFQPFNDGGRWYRGGGLLVRKYSQFLATVGVPEIGAHAPASNFLYFHRTRMAPMRR